MNKVHLPILALALTFTVLWSCQTDATPKPKALTNSKDDVKWSFYHSGDLFVKIMGDKNGQGADKILRGLNIGDHPDSLAIKESGTLQVDETVMKGYFQDLNDAEFVSSYYYFDENNFMSGANVKVNLVSDSTAEDLYYELKLYFEQKYGKSFHGLNKYETWNALSVDSFPYVIGLKFERGVFPENDSIEPEFSKVLINLEESDF
jgi:hypothetical protein